MKKQKEYNRTGTKRLFITFFALCWGLATYAQQYESWSFYGSYGLKQKGNEKVWVVPPMYDCTWSYDKEESPILGVQRGNRYGFIDEDNDIILPFEYLNMSHFFDRLATVQMSDSLYYVIDLHGKVVSKGFDRLISRPGLFFGKENKGWHHVYDKALKPLGNPEGYLEMGYRVVNIRGTYYPYFCVQGRNGKWGLLDARGQEIVPCIYETMQSDAPVSYLYNDAGKLNKGGLKNSDFEGMFIVSKIMKVEKYGYKDIRYGVINLKGEEVIPLKQVSSAGVKQEHRKYWKKAFLPYIQNQTNLQLAESLLKPALERNLQEARQLTAQYPSTYIEPHYPTLQIVKQPKGMALMDGAKKVGDSYAAITAGDRYFIVKDAAGQYGMLGRDGGETLPCQYTSIVPFRKMEKGGDLLLLLRNGKYGMAWADGDIMLPCWYDQIDSIPGHDVFMAKDGNDYWLYKKTGSAKHRYAYDSYSYDAQTGKATVGYGNGLITGVIDKWGNDGFCRRLYNEGNTTVVNEYKIAKYVYALQVSDSDDSPLTLDILKRLGNTYAKMGDMEKAQTFFFTAMSRGDVEAERELNRAINRGTQEEDGFSSFLETMTGLMNSIATLKNGNVPPSSSVSDAGGDGGGSTTPSGTDYASYKSMYDRWDRRAKELYEDLTSRGSRTSRGGKASSGSAGGYWKGSAFSSLKQNLRDAQKNMRRIRGEARQAGHNIPQSTYETVQVSY